MQHDAIGGAIHRLHPYFTAGRVGVVRRLGIVRTARQKLGDEGTAIGLAIAICRTGSTAMPPHSNMPRLPGNTSVPCKDGGVNVPS